MPRNPKIFIHNTLVELSSRTQEGLPFPPSRLTFLILGNIIARAQEMYPITISALCIMPNHFHILAVVHSPEDVSNFVEYLKRESANAINKLMGRRQHSVWTTGYDSPIILDSHTALKRMKYIYLNPVSAGLVPNASEWKLSSASWIDSSSTVIKRKFKVIPRDRIPTLPDRKISIKEINEICDSLENIDGSEEATLTIEPYAWKRCFSDIKEKNNDHIHDLLFSQIKKEEKKIQNEKENSFPSLASLQTHDIRTPYTPKKFGKRMICISEFKSIRIKFISWAKNYVKNHPRFKKLIHGFYSDSMEYPPGLFAPGGIMFANLLPDFTPIPYL